MKCIVTAGPTYEPLDDVRRLTNLSTGRLGTDLAAFLASRGHDVTLFRGEQATWTEAVKAKVVKFTTTSDLRDGLKAAAADNVQAVFHAAAVSDFGFGKVWQRTATGELVPIKSGKVSSRLDNLFAELVPTPKIIAELRTCYPNAFLVGWKFEVDGDRESVIAQARKQIAENRTDACVANGPAYGEGFGIVTADVQHCVTREELFERLLAILPKRAG
jgi:phosphopantothenoylcysteine decarboxylase/phosphopantothenate--cysteine ligase